MPPDYTPTEEAVEMPPWRPGQPRYDIRLYPHGREPLLWVYVYGDWHEATVRARHRYRTGTAYQVGIRLPAQQPGTYGNFSRTYRWGTPAVQVRTRELPEEQARAAIDRVMSD
ncbi:hypothetical protein [Streptacidiphilus cavernicola]|uniref:Uncharacterized protein n=1 Tax=Streptacidiphilus cavernicola TaxID=3342716 RepID=A0ABV6VXQ3_9ACTN